MKSGIELITQEREEQLGKHGRDVRSDVYYNSVSEDGYLPLVCGAIYLTDDNFKRTPSHWNKEILNKMRGKDYKERLIIAAALIAAEIDRLQSASVDTQEEVIKF